MRSFLNLNSIPNVAAGNSCSIKLPIGQTYEVHCEDHGDHDDH